MNLFLEHIFKVFRCILVAPGRPRLWYRRFSPISLLKFYDDNLKVILDICLYFAFSISGSKSPYFLTRL